MNFNLDSAEGNNFLKLITILEKSNDVKINYKFFYIRIVDCLIQVVENSLILKNLNWRPIRNFEAMFKSDFYWLLNNLEIYLN